MEKNIFIFDENKCVGCHACVVACMNENGFQSSGLWRNIYDSNPNHIPELPLFYLSLACNHCDDAPCMKNCPANAYSRDEKTGAVIHHPEKCIGCKYCTWACPYDAPRFNPKQGIIEKCTFCNHRIEDNLKPACANHCPVGALDFAYKEFTREQSTNSSPVPVNVGSKLKTIPLKNNSGPEMDLNLFSHQVNPKKDKKEKSKISAVTEWPLIFFTLLSAGLVGTYSSGITQLFANFEKHIFFAVAIIAAMLSMLHLGKKQRAWRSLINLKSSWLSREILFFALFITALGFDFYLFDIPAMVVSALGLLLLFSIDMLYSLATWKWPVKNHSAQTLFIGITFYAILTANIYLLTIITSFRLTLYLYKSILYKKLNLLVFVRSIILLFVFGLFATNQNIIPILILTGIGEIIDRIGFYNELSVPKPGNEIL